MSGGVRAMKSKTTAAAVVARAPSPLMRNGSVPSAAGRVERRSKSIALEGLARLSTDVFSENPIEHMSSFSDNTKSPFLGVVVCVTGFSREARREVQITTERMGGLYSRDLHVNCTHLVVQNCSGRKYEHAVKHGVHRGLHVVTMSWFEDCVKQNARLDESMYMVPRTNGQARDGRDSLPEAMGSSNRRKFPSADQQDLEAAVRPISFTNSSGGSLRNSSSMPRTPHSSLATDKSCHALAGARFYIDSDLPHDLQLKAQEAAESWGATCVENWSKATHVVCESETISKYIGLNLHLVSPMWVMSARDGFPLRCVQYSADLARDVADLLLEGTKKGKHDRKVKNGVENELVYELLTMGSVENYTVHFNGSRGVAVTAQERELKAVAAKEGVRRRRGPRMQPCRTLPRLNTPTSLLESIFWVVSEAPATAQFYTNSTGKVVVGNGAASESDPGFHHHNVVRYRDPLDEALGTEIYSKALTGSDKREIVFQGAFLTILFPIDRFYELGPSSQTFFSETGFTREQIIDLVYTFYQEPLSPAEVEAALHTDSKHADRLRASYASTQQDEQGHVAMPRHQFLGTRLQFEGLKRANQEPTSHIYDLWLGL